MYRKKILLSMFFLSCFGAQVSFASDYAARRAAAVKKCEAINPSESRSGLMFNPDGYKSYYVRSLCFQEAAVQFRDLGMCDRVRRRISLFWSSWGVSTAECRKLVSNGIAQDRTELESEKRLYASGAMKLRSFRIQRNGNGRDFDILPEFSAGNGHGYRLTFEILDASPQPILLHSDGYYIDPKSQLRVFVRQADVRARFPQFDLNRVYKVRATVVLSTPMGGTSSYWSDEFLESVFPESQRSQSVTIESRF
jgi:hypothetical protein